MQFYDRKDNIMNIASDLEFKHTPDSVCEDARRELKERGYSEEQISEMENTGKPPVK